MNNQEAKLILQAYRLGGQDAADPQFQEALQQLQHDPELAEWFAQERAIETRVQAKIRDAVKPPPHLKAHLLAQGSIVRHAAWWRRPLWLAAAASIALLGIVVTIWSRRSSAPQFAAFRQAMVQNALQTTDHVSFETHDLARIQQWLKDRDVDTNLDLPIALRDHPEGCRVVHWNGQKITLICFVLNGTDHVDLFVLNSARFRGFTPSQTPEFGRTAGGLTTATWTTGSKTYLLATSGSAAVLRKYL